MTEKVIFAGFGGQGVLFAGKLLAAGGMESGMNVSWLPAYGPEMRGGTANCSVIVSEKKIGSPIIENPTVLIALNRPSLEKFAPKVVPGGLIICNAADLDEGSRTDLQMLPLAFDDISRQLETNGLMNIVTLGALLGCRQVLSLSCISEILNEGKTGEIRARKNLDALELGHRIAVEIQPIS